MFNESAAFPPCREMTWAELPYESHVGCVVENRWAKARHGFSQLGSQWESSGETGCWGWKEMDTSPRSLAHRVSRTCNEMGTGVMARKPSQTAPRVLVG